MNNSLAEVRPELVSEWSEKNLPLKPDEITFGSNKKVWWRGACGHEWQTSVKARSNGEKCPICSGARVIAGINDLATLEPLLVKQWSKKNKIKPTEVSIGFSDRLLQQYGITVKKSRGRLSYLPAGRKKFIRAHSLGDKFEKELVLATLKENAKSQPIILHSNLEEKPDRIKKLVDIQAKLKQGKGIGYERWAKKHNLKAMAQTLILLQEKGLLNEDALDQRIAELDTKFHESLAVVKDLETRMANNQTLRRYAASYKQYRPLAQKRNAAKSPATFEEQHRAELTAYRTAAAYLKANNITKLPSPNKLEAEYCALASEKAQFYEQYKEAKIELLKLKDAKQNVALFFREDERTQHHER